MARPGSEHVSNNFYSNAANEYMKKEARGWGDDN